MNNPKTLLSDYVIGPVYNFYQKYVGSQARQEYCQTIADFIFKRSKETAVIMLIFNSVSILSSHVSQIRGLKKGSRENKDYLINQEWKELGLDLLLTVVPPFLLNNFLKKKLDSGQWATKSSIDNLTRIIAPTVGASKDELYNVEPGTPIIQTIKDFSVQIIRTLKNSSKTPQKLKSKLPNIPIPPGNKIPIASMEDITTDFDIIRKGKFKGFRNGKAFDEICGQRDGLLILTTIGYTILASNIIMPIFKNKLANYSYKKKLEKMGETSESLKRKKRFGSIKTPEVNEEEKHIFNVFLTNDYGIPKHEENLSDLKLAIPQPKNKPFDNINKFQYKSNGLKI